MRAVALAFHKGEVREVVQVLHDEAADRPPDGSANTIPLFGTDASTIPSADYRSNAETDACTHP